MADDFADEWWEGIGKDSGSTFPGPRGEAKTYGDRAESEYSPQPIRGEAKEPWRDIGSERGPVYHAGVAKPPPQMGPPPPPMPMPFTQADNLTLQKYQQALSTAQKQIDDGTLSEQDGTALKQQIVQRMQPLQMRQEQSRQQNMQSEAKKMQQQTALQEGMAHSNAVFRARGLHDRVSVITDTMTGQRATMLETSPNSWEQIKFGSEGGEEPWKSESSDYFAPPWMQTAVAQGAPVPGASATGGVATGTSPLDELVRRARDDAAARILREASGAPNMGPQEPTADPFAGAEDVVRAQAENFDRSGGPPDPFAGAEDVIRQQAENFDRPSSDAPKPEPTTPDEEWQEAMEAQAPAGRNISGSVNPAPPGPSRGTPNLPPWAQQMDKANAANKQRDAALRAKAQAMGLIPRSPTQPGQPGQGAPGQQQGGQGQQGVGAMHPAEMRQIYDAANRAIPQLNIPTGPVSQQQQAFLQRSILERQGAVTQLANHLMTQELNRRNTKAAQRQQQGYLNSLDLLQKRQEGSSKALQQKQEFSEIEKDKDRVAKQKLQDERLEAKEMEEKKEKKVTTQRDWITGSVRHHIAQLQKQHKEYTTPDSKGGPGYKDEDLDKKYTDHDQQFKVATYRAIKEYEVLHGEMPEGWEWDKEGWATRTPKSTPTSGGKPGANMPHVPGEEAPATPGIPETPGTVPATAPPEARMEDTIKRLAGSTSTEAKRLLEEIKKRMGGK